MLKKALETKAVDAVLAPLRLSGKQMAMPALVAAPGLLDDADPLAPAFPMNGAKLVSKLTRKNMGQTVAAVLRSCEIRAFVEAMPGSLEEPAGDEAKSTGDAIAGFIKDMYLK